MGRSRHTVTKYLSDEKKHCAINSKICKKLDHVNHQLYEVELEKAEVEHKEPVVVGFFILQYAKLRMLELYYNFFNKFYDNNKFEELEMDTDSLYLALAEQESANCIRPEMKAEWENMGTTDCDDRFVADASRNFFPRTCCAKPKKKHVKREPGLFKEEFKYLELLCLSSEFCCCYDTTSNKLNFSSNKQGLNRPVLERSGDGPLEKYRKVHDEAVNIKSTNRVFRRKDHTVATHKQTERGLSYFYAKRIVEDDAIHTHTHLICGFNFHLLDFVLYLLLHYVLLYFSWIRLLLLSM